MIKAVDSANFLLQARLNRHSVPAAAVHPFDLPLFQHFTHIDFPTPVTFIVGENGSGKSTLLEALALGMGFNAEGGGRNFNFSTRPTHSSLHQALLFIKGVALPQDGYFLRAESFYNVASQIDDLGAVMSYGGTSLHERSHGEAFMALFAQRFRGHGLYILDEPEAALSPTRQLQLLRYIYELVQLSSQFIIATHSPILLSYPGSTIYEITDHRFRQVQYEATEHYQITKTFLDGYRYALDELFKDGGKPLS